MTLATVAKLEEAFLWGCTDLEACVYAEVSKHSLYRYQEEHPEFRDRKEMLKSNPVMRARKVLLDALDDDDRNIANKIIDRKEGSKVALTGPDGGPIQTEHTEITKDMDPKEAQRQFMKAARAGKL